MSGGRIAIYPPKDCPIDPAENIIVGNTVLYGAISGECYFNGVAASVLRCAIRALLPLLKAWAIMAANI